MAADTLSGTQRQPVRAGPPLRDNHAALTQSACTSGGCLVYEMNLCVGVRKKATSSQGWKIDASRFTSSAAHKISGRRSIIHPKENSEFVVIICHGWAARSIMAPDGHRQILSFLLPGDLISTANLFAPMSGHYIDAITDVIYRKFKQSELKATLFDCPALLEKLSTIWVDERAQADQLALNISRISANERIASLILSLAKRLANTEMVDGLTMDFPLRQHHIADATGLNHVYVGKVLGKLQRFGLIEISDRSLRIVDKEKLRQAASRQ